MAQPFSPPINKSAPNKWKNQFKLHNIIAPFSASLVVSQCRVYLVTCWPVLS